MGGAVEVKLDGAERARVARSALSLFALRG